LSGHTWSDPVAINGQPPPKSDPVYLSLVAPRYFETMGTPLVLGREFSAGDRPGAPGAAIVNESFGRQFLEGRPLGQRISVANPRFSFFEVVGVVKDTLSRSLRESAPPSVYLPAAQYPEMIGAAYFELRVEASLVRTAALVRDELHVRFPATPAEVQVEPLTEQVGRTLNQESMLAALGACFGSLALILAAVGLYGVLAYTVARSTSEIGIRIALGAKRGEVLRWVLMRALRLVAAGVAIGIPIAWASTRLIGSMLFGLRATDPVTGLIALSLLIGTALAAAFIPALRAARVDPIVALRYE
jgi:predicted permease